MSSTERAAALQMLNQVRNVVKAEYYDKNLHGVDLDARYISAKEQLSNAHLLQEAYLLSAWMLEPLDDSHTLFIPPWGRYRLEPGYRMEFVADRCYITVVQAGNDAADQGLRPGDQVLEMEGIRLERNSFWKAQYALETLAPRSVMHLLVAAPDAKPRQILVKARVSKLPDGQEGLTRISRIREFGDVAVWRLSSFNLDGRELEQVCERMRTHRALILDLRGNPGGLASALKALLGSILDGDMQIAQRVARNFVEPIRVKSARADKRFSGKLVVLVDSESASAAEIAARVIQLKERGTVIGDRSAGRVMEGRFELYEASGGTYQYQLPFGVQVTSADFIMEDGKSLEHHGVVPDEIVLPSRQDLFAGRDPVLSRAAQICGLELTPEKAGSQFGVMWLSSN